MWSWTMTAESWYRPVVTSRSQSPDHDNGVADHLAAKIFDPYFTTKVTAVHDDHEAVQLCESALRKGEEF
jgi:hypothetical protein